MPKLYHNGNIYTMESETSTVQAVLESNGKIIEVGNYNELKEKATEIIDLNGQTMLPGFVDVHLHMVMLGKMLSMLTLYDHTDVEQIKLDIQQYHNNRKWNIILGYDENRLPSKYKMTRDDLDLITDKPTLVMRTCHHAGIVNSKAFEALNIDDDVEDMEGGHFEKDENGRLTGWVFDKAFELVRHHTVDDTVDSLSDDIKNAIAHLVSKGFTGAHTEDLSYYGNAHTPLRAFINTIGENQTKFRVRLLNHEEQYLTVKSADVQYKKDWVELDAMKIFVDGSFGSKTALLQQPYEGTEQYGLSIHTQEKLNQLVKTAREHHDAVAAHLIGDAALKMMLEAIETHPVRQGLHDRLIHVSLIDKNLLDRMAKLSVICDVQPTFLSSDLPFIESYIGKERLKNVYAFKSILDKNIIIGSSSDAPIESVDALQAIYTLETREFKGETVNESERLTRFEAIQTYTVNAAKIAYNDDRFGHIKRGYYADLVIFDKDIMNVAPKDLLHTNVTQTIIHGEVVYNQ